jgi:hypothetical protein
MGFLRCFLENGADRASPTQILGGWSIGQPVSASSPIPRDIDAFNDNLGTSSKMHNSTLFCTLPHLYPFLRARRVSLKFDILLMCCYTKGVL